MHFHTNVDILEHTIVISRNKEGLQRLYFLYTDASLTQYQCSAISTTVLTGAEIRRDKEGAARLYPQSPCAFRNVLRQERLAAVILPVYRCKPVQRHFHYSAHRRRNSSRQGRSGSVYPQSPCAFRSALRQERLAAVILSVYRCKPDAVSVRLWTRRSDCAVTDPYNYVV